MAVKKKRVLVCTINNWPYLHHLFVDSLTQMIQYSQKIPNMDVEFDWVWGSYVDAMRNNAAEKAVKGDYDFLLMLDADQYYPANTVEKLVNNDKPVCGGLYYWKTLKCAKDKNGNLKKGNGGIQYTYAPHAYKKRKAMFGEARYDHLWEIDDKDGLQEVDGLGGGGMCIRKDVFDKMDAPFFECFWTAGAMSGEDLNFCINAQAKGFKIFIDLDLEFGHITQSVVANKRLNDMMGYAEEMKMSKSIFSGPKPFHPDEITENLKKKANRDEERKNRKLNIKKLIKETTK
jgi:hypothetical protein